jgi:O-antigen/teichoic acid export membrane protein
MGLCLLGSVAGLGILSFGGPFMLEIFAGSAYAGAGSYLAWYAIAMALFGGATVLIASWQARGRGEFLAVLVPITLLEPLLIAAFHQTAGTVAQVVALSMALLFGSLGALYLLQERTREVPRVALETAV